MSFETNPLNDKSTCNLRTIMPQVREKRVEDTERFITLVQIDNGWANYLTYVSSVREGIHLESLSHKNPLHEYHRLIINAYATLEERIETAVVELFLTTDFSSLKMDFQLEALRVPSATWTYMINDSFFRTESIFYKRNKHFDCGSGFPHRPSRSLNSLLTDD